MTSYLKKLNIIAREQYPEKSDALHPFIWLGNQENTYSTSSHMYLDCRVRNRTKRCDFKTHSKFANHKKQNYPNMLHSRRQVMSSPVLFLYMQDIKSKSFMNSLCEWETVSICLNAHTLEPVKPRFMFWYCILQEGRLQGTLLTWTSQKQMTWGSTKQCIFSVSCLGKWMFFHNC